MQAATQALFIGYLFKKHGVTDKKEKERGINAYL